MMTPSTKTLAQYDASGDLKGKHRSEVIIDGGQAGLSMSYCLTRHGVDHVVLERDRVGHEWRDRRWDSFCLVTPNWQCQLPGFPYDGDDPGGFMARAKIVEYLDEYARLVDPPLVEVSRRSDCAATAKAGT